MDKKIKKRTNGGKVRDKNEKMRKMRINSRRNEKIIKMREKN